MKIYTLIGLIFILLVSALKLSAQTADGSKLELSPFWSDAQKEILTSKLAPFPKNSQISIAVIDGDNTEYLGIINDEWTLETVENKHAIFEIGSISKVFTSALLSKAVKDKKVSLDTEITDLIGYKLLNDQKINLKQLSNHTSGLQRMPMNFMFAQMKAPANPFSEYTPEMLESYLSKYMTPELDQSSYGYSNLGAGLLGHGLTKVYDKSYEQLLQEHIFGPFGMESSTTDSLRAGDDVIPGLDQHGQKTSHWSFAVLHGAGAIMSNVTDLEIFAKKILKDDNEILKVLNSPTYEISDNMSIAMGWHIIKGKNGGEYLWHNGGTQGYTSSMIIDIENHRSIILLSNISAYHADMGNIDQILFELMKNLKANK